MTTPQQPLSRTSLTPQETQKRLSILSARSIYCAYCLCGRYFETASRDWSCPYCDRHIVLDWGHGEADAQNCRSHNRSTPTEAA
jgi:hypothetical protein